MTTWRIQVVDCSHQHGVAEIAWLVMMWGMIASKEMGGKTPISLKPPLSRMAPS
jgi:hypothetical protein